MLPRENPARGVVLMAAAFAVFASTDAVVKHLTATIPAYEVTWSRFVVHVGAMLAVVAATGWRRGLRTQRPGLHIARGAFQLVTNGLVTLGLAALPLAEAIALGMTTPLFVTALSVLLLGEAVGWRRWSALLVGFAGMLLIMRPGTPAFDPASLLLLTAAITGAVGLVLTRRMSGEDSITTLLSAAVVGLVGSTPFAIAVWVTPRPLEVALMALNGAANLFAQWLAVRAMVHAPASTVAPIQFSHVAWATALSVLAFGVWPDSWTLAGATIIVASGLYVWWRERATAERARALASVPAMRINGGLRRGDE